MSNKIIKIILLYILLLTNVYAARPITSTKGYPLLHEFVQEFLPDIEKRYRSSMINGTNGVLKEKKEKKEKVLSESLEQYDVVSSVGGKSDYKVEIIPYRADTFNIIFKESEAQYCQVDMVWRQGEKSSSGNVNDSNRCVFGPLIQCMIAHSSSNVEYLHWNLRINKGEQAEFRSINEALVYMSSG